MTLAAFAPAKVNLFLHVGPPGADGYHPICSWMSFADVGDRLAFEASDGPELIVEGPFAEALSGTPPSGNLVMRAAVAALGPDRGFRLRLHKALPVAAGLGGGSCDAGAALRLLRRACGLALDDAALGRIAASLGADGSACLWGRPVIAEGRGERLGRAPAAPLLDAVLVNPRVPCPTAAVYRAYDRGAIAAPDRPDLPERFDSAGAVAEALARCRNDLETAAVALEPRVARCLELLRAQPQSLLARLSGSGATCFALCDGPKAAQRLAGEVASAEPEWWVRACRLGGPWPDA